MIIELERNGYDLLVTARDKEFTLSLLDHYNIAYKKRLSNKKGLISKLFGLFYITRNLYNIQKEFKPDLFIGGAGNAYIALLGFLTKKPSIVFDDTEHDSQKLFFVKHFASSIVTPDCYQKDLGEKQVRYAGYHELAYLHPNRFSPSEEVLSNFKGHTSENYSILRFVSWEASHDAGHSGMSSDNKLHAIKKISEYSKAYISSELPLTSELKPYQFSLDPHMMHDALAFSSLVFGESATMASEAAVLGIPAIYLDDESRVYTKELEEKYGLVFNYTESESDQKQAVEKAGQLLSNAEQNKRQWRSKRNKLLEDKIDVTAYMVWFIENYPDSVTVMKETPNYQFNFK
jgi:uncharacterized protein